MFENARRRKSKNRQYSGKKKGNDVNIYKSLHRILQVEHHEHHYKPRVELWKWQAISAPQVTPVSLLLNGANASTTVMWLRRTSFCESRPCN